MLVFFRVRCPLVCRSIARSWNIVIKPRLNLAVYLSLNICDFGIVYGTDKFIHLLFCNLINGLPAQGKTVRNDIYLSGIHICPEHNLPVFFYGQSPGIDPFSIYSNGGQDSDDRITVYCHSGIIGFASVCGYSPCFSGHAPNNIGLRQNRLVVHKIFFTSVCLSFNRGKKSAGAFNLLSKFLKCLFSFVSFLLKFFPVVYINLRNLAVPCRTFSRRGLSAKGC